MPVLESSIERRVCQVAATAWGLRNFKLTIEGQRGWPDRLFLIPGGRPLLIEFKRPGEKPDPLQEHRLATLKALGYDATWHNTVDGALLELAQAMDAAQVPAKRRSVAP